MLFGIAQPKQSHQAMSDGIDSACVMAVPEPQVNAEHLRPRRQHGTGDQVILTAEVLTDLDDPLSA